MDNNPAVGHRVSTAPLMEVFGNTPVYRFDSAGNLAAVDRITYAKPFRTIEDLKAG